MVAGFSRLFKPDSVATNEGGARVRLRRLPLRARTAALVLSRRSVSVFFTWSGGTEYQLVSKRHRGCGGRGR